MKWSPISAKRLPTCDVASPDRALIGAPAISNARVSTLELGVCLGHYHPITTFVQRAWTGPVIDVKGLSGQAACACPCRQQDRRKRRPLATELPELAEILVENSLDISIAGFAAVEIDQITTSFEDDTSDPVDAVDRA
jgi:hypothetical protein